MSLGTNNPGNRTHQSRRIKANLKRHDELMKKWVGEGLSREDASRVALLEMQMRLENEVRS